MPPSALNQARDKYRNMKSGGGVLCISILQLIVGLVLLGIYEGYKVRQADNIRLKAHSKALSDSLKIKFWNATDKIFQ